MKKNKIYAYTASFVAIIAMIVFMAGFSGVFAKNVQLAESEGENNSSSANIGSNASGTNGLGIGTSIAPGLQGKNQTESEVENGLNNAFNAGLGSSPEATPLSMSIGPQGQARITNGNVTAVSGNMLTVSVFGISLSVDISNANIVGAMALPPIPSTATSSATSTGATPSTTSINAGDKVVVQGTIDSTTGIIKASAVRDLSAQVQSNSDIVNRINQLMDMINQLKARLGM